MRSIVVQLILPISVVIQSGEPADLFFPATVPIDDVQCSTQ